jgi:hypothetical protein
MKLVRVVAAGSSSLGWRLNRIAVVFLPDGRMCESLAAF